VAFFFARLMRRARLRKMAGKTEPAY